jgi:hypothetical protein
VYLNQGEDGTAGDSIILQRLGRLHLRPSAIGLFQTVTQNLQNLKQKTSVTTEGISVHQCCLLIRGCVLVVDTTYANEASYEIRSCVVQTSPPATWTPR